MAKPVDEMDAQEIPIIKVLLEKIESGEIDNKEALRILAAWCNVVFGKEYEPYEENGNG